ncbi:MAG: substrate-binding periplasmic protein [Gaiella sp.]
MSGRGVAATVVGGLGLVAVVVTSAAVAAVALIALGLPAEGRAEDAPPAPVDQVATPAPSAPRVLVVALAPGDPVLQAGVVRGRDVLLARGFEVAVARALAERLRVPDVRFVRAPSAQRILLGETTGWDVAFAAIRPTRLAFDRGTVTRSYLSTDSVVLLRRGTARPRTLGDLRTRILCAIRGTEAARTASWVRPAERVMVAPGPERLIRLVQTGACDAALLDAVAAARVVEGHRAVLGPIAARVRWDGGLVAIVHPDAPVAADRVDRALGALRANGTLGRLARFWLGFDPASLPVVR